jgi:hypothetical protein
MHLPSSQATHCQHFLIFLFIWLRIVLILDAFLIPLSLFFYDLFIFSSLFSFVSSFLSANLVMKAWPRETGEKKIKVGLFSSTEFLCPTGERERGRDRTGHQVFHKKVFKMAAMCVGCNCKLIFLQEQTVLQTLVDVHNELNLHNCPLRSMYSCRGRRYRSEL